jgi:hypothetical protein
MLNCRRSLSASRYYEHTTPTRTEPDTRVGLLELLRRRGPARVDPPPQFAVLLVAAPGDARVARQTRYWNEYLSRTPKVATTLK